MLERVLLLTYLDEGTSKIQGCSGLKKHSDIPEAYERFGIDVCINPLKHLQAGTQRSCVLLDESLLQYCINMGKEEMG